MPVDTIRRMTAAQIRSAVEGFAARYAKDWEGWLTANHDARPGLFGRILRRWQAARPRKMRRLQQEASHKAPFLDDLLRDAEQPLRVLEGLGVATIAVRTLAQNEALAHLWENFSRLPTTGIASCVGITKAVKLLTNGRIGPAFDSRVRASLGVARPGTCFEWVRCLEEVSEDIAAFERSRGSLAAVVPAQFAELAYGRLYDMALGPRG